MTIWRFLKQEPSLSSMKPKVFMSRMVRAQPHNGDGLAAQPLLVGKDRGDGDAIHSRSLDSCNFSLRG